MTKILLVDDEPDALETLKFRFEQSGYEVLTAENGVRALDILRDCPVDLVLTDFMMPELNGLEMARMIKSSQNLFDTRIMLFSCNTDPEFRKRAADIGVLDFVAKTDGFLRIIERAQQLAPVTRPHYPERSEDAFRIQLHSLARGLKDVLKLAEITAPLPEPTRIALDSANRIARDLERLTAAPASRAANPALPDSDKTYDSTIVTPVLHFTDT
ncbi:MAG: response regulator [Acidobacteria bacterium]|nr:response regulator [Acidobacteriota bacterium]